MAKSGPRPTWPNFG